MGLWGLWSAGLRLEEDIVGGRSKDIGERKKKLFG